MVGWANASQSLEEDLRAFKAAIMVDLKEQDLKFKHSFEDFGKQAFLYRLKQFYDHNEPVEAAIRETRDILSINKSTDNEPGETI